MIQDPNVERLIRKSIEPLNKQISMLQIELNGVKEQLAIPRVVSSATYNADHLWKKATEFTYALEKNGYLACLEDLEKAGIIELKNIDKNH